MAEQTPLVLYIASTSRSGSTVLDRLLGAQQGCVSVGEMRVLQGFALKSHAACHYRDPTYPLQCSCGADVTDCEFWSSVAEAAGLDLAAAPFMSTASAPWRRLVQLACLARCNGLLRTVGSLAPPVKGELAAAGRCWRVYEGIGAATDARVVVDSSKCIYHFSLLRCLQPGRIRLLRLYRDGRAVVHSMTRGERADLWDSSLGSPVAQAAAHWEKEIRRIELLSRPVPEEQQMSLRYEDLCAAPQDALQVIFGDLLGIDQDLSASLSEAPFHNIGGSPSRLDPKASEIQIDDRWQDAMSPDDLAVFERLAGEANRRLGYEKDGPRP